MMAVVAGVQWRLTQLAVPQLTVLVGSVAAGAVVYGGLMYWWRPSAVTELWGLVRRARQPQPAPTEVV